MDIFYQISKPRFILLLTSISLYVNKAYTIASPLSHNRRSRVISLTHSCMQQQFPPSNRARLTMRARLLQRHPLRRALPLVELAADPIPVADVDGRVRAGREALERERELGGHGARGARVVREGAVVHVVGRVAREVVAGVLGGAGAGEEARGRDAELEEADVVAGGAEAAVEGLAGARRQEVVVQLGRPELVARVVALVDGERREWRPDHVVVEVEPDAVGVGGRQARRVEERADQAALLGPPPREAHLVREAGVLRERRRDLQQRRRPGPVVVDAGAGLHRVQVRAQHHHVVGVALAGLGEDVPGLAVLEDGVDGEVHLELLVARREALLPPLSHLFPDGAHGHQEADVLGAERRLRGRALHLVVQDDGFRAGRLG